MSHLQCECIYRLKPEGYAITIAANLRGAKERTLWDQFVTRSLHGCSSVIA